jgi:ACS family hexuronate transporter-like MFS transporter
MLKSLRWWVLLMLFGAITLNILDRQVLSLVAPLLRDQFHFSNTQYGMIVFAFLFGLTLGQVPIGLLMDRKGARFGFSLIVVWWSIANMLHALAGSVLQFGFLRFLLGLGECGTYSGSVKVISQWFPARERALAGGIFASGSLLGSIAAPPLIVYLAIHYGWRTAFLLPSTVGLLWIIPWLLIYWEPWRHPRIGADARAAAKEQIAKQHAPEKGDRLRLLLAQPVVWGVVLMRALGGPVTHFYWYWLPEYLKRERALSMEMIGLLAWLPFFFGGAGGIAGGWFSSALLRRGWSVNRARKTAFGVSVALCLFAVAVPLVPGAGWAVALICVASAGINAYSATFIGLLTDLFPERILAKVSGLTGIGDGSVSMVLMLVTGIVVDRFSYLPIFIAAGLMPVLGLTALLSLIRVIKPMAADQITGPVSPQTPGGSGSLAR